VKTFAAHRRHCQLAYPPKLCPCIGRVGQRDGVCVGVIADIDIRNARATAWKRPTQGEIYGVGFTAVVCYLVCFLKPRQHVFPLSAPGADYRPRQGFDPAV